MIRQQQRADTAYQHVLSDAVRHHENGRYAEAERLYRQVLSVQPGQPDALRLLAVMAQQHGKVGLAAQMLQQVTSAHPDNAPAHVNYGIALFLQGKLEESESVLLHALRLDDRLADAHHALGNVYRSQSRFSYAETAFRRAIRLKSDYVEAHYSLGLTKKYTSDDEDLAALRRLAGKLPAMPAKQACELYFALGKAHDDVGAFDEAARFFQRGNETRRATFRYDVNAQLQHFQRVTQVFGPDLLKRLSNTGNDSQVPVFVVGMPRSGTTLVERILASHPQVHGAGELDYMTRTAGALHKLTGGDSAYPSAVGRLAAQHCRIAGDHYAALIRQRVPDALRVVDKMPMNFEFVGLIHLLLPNARIIHCRRQPLDTCLSCYQQLFTASMEYTYDLSELGSYYRGYTQMMEHWERVLPDKMLHVQYEELVADPATQTRRMLEFCGLEWNEACLHHDRRANGGVITASAWQSRQAVYHTSVNRHRHYTRYLGPLTDAMGNLAQDHREVPHPYGSGAPL